ncbi:MAG: rhodanese-like domain-containing protein [Gemmobacter sp.]
MQLSRRAVLGGTLAAGLAVPAGIALWNRYGPLPDAARLDAPAAHRMALAGTVMLIDIRRPDEWAATGTGEGAHRLDMRRGDFTEALAALMRGDRTAPLALICARGVRSARLAARLEAAGLRAVADVAEGMLGSGAGPGWIARGLPVVRG